MISNEMLYKYNMKPYEEYLKDFKEFPEVAFYQTFLIQTDHIPNKIVEAQITRVTTEDYTEILKARQFARDKINELSQSGGGVTLNPLSELIREGVIC